LKLDYPVQPSYLQSMIMEYRAKTLIHNQWHNLYRV
jgi:hypothetical protein